MIESETDYNEQRLIDINIKQSNQMAMEQYPQETIPQTNFVKDSETTSDKWKSLSESIDESENSPSAGFDCNICLDSVQDPVVTLCGHLYCWPCIYKWIQHQNTSSETPNKHNPQCPVCKHGISQKTLVPLYSQGQTTKPQSEEKGLDLGMSIPRRPVSPSFGVVRGPTEQVNYGGYQQQAQNLINPTSPTTGMLGEMMYGGLFGNTQASLYTYPNSYNLVTISTQRARRHAIHADRSLGRIWFFLFCCIMLCLVLF
ncbi:unnamed protein product [Lactuca virosa]|uniref:E3 ubiquitin-protein ligase RMA n=1 Tax=Lactuca virosa TaxID=75947 RepID=A0AAU9MS09_9ASTR|nr:unnamed protein product [Lactuca virosa]